MMTTPTDRIEHAPATAPTAGTIMAGIGVAALLQLLAVVAAITSMGVVLMAAFANYGSYGAEQESTWWVVFAVPLATTALVAYIISGFAASKVMRSGLGWLTLLMLPSVLVALAAMS